MNEKVDLNPFKDEDVEYIKETGLTILGVFDTVLSSMLTFLLPAILYDTIYNPEVGWSALLNFIFMFALGIILGGLMAYWKINTYSQMVDVFEQEEKNEW